MADFKLNSVPGYMHVVSAGETLKEIAKKNGVSVSELIKANPEGVAQAKNGNYYAKADAVLSIPQKTAVATQNRAKIFEDDPVWRDIQKFEKLARLSVGDDPNPPASQPKFKVGSYVSFRDGICDDPINGLVRGEIRDVTSRDGSYSYRVREENGRYWTVSEGSLKADPVAQQHADIKAQALDKEWKEALRARETLNPFD